MCVFFGIYDILLPLVVLVVSNRNLCAQVFFLFSRRLILEKIPIGEWFEGWGLKTPSKDLPNRKRVPLRTRVAPGGSDPGEIDSFPRIGLVRVLVSLSLSFGPSLKRLSVQWAQSHTTRRTSRTTPNVGQSPISKQNASLPDVNSPGSLEPPASTEQNSNLRWSLFMGSGSSRDQSLNSLLMTAKPTM